MAKEFYTVNVIPHLENETGEYDYVPTFEVRIDKGGKEKSSMARCLCRLDKFDAHRILRQLNDAGSVVFEVTVAYLLSQSI